MQDACLMNFNFNLFLAPTAGGLQWDQFLECGKSGLRQHKRIAGDARPQVDTTRTTISSREQQQPVLVQDSEPRIGVENFYAIIIQQCFQSCIHTAYSPYYSNIQWTFGITGAVISQTSMFRPAKWFKDSSFQRCEKTLVCSFSPARSRNWLSPWQQRWWTLAHLRGGHDKKWWQFAVHLLFLVQTVMVLYGCYY